MQSLRVLAAAVFGLFGSTAFGCARTEQPPVRAGVTNVQAAEPGQEQRVHELLSAAALEIRDLERMRSETTRTRTRAAIDARVDAVGRARARLIANRSATAPGARLDDVENLDRALQNGAALTPRGSRPAAILGADTPLGGSPGDVTYPPFR
ncbi:MAG: hypothetical protein ABSC94_09835 [Polyangiaceae bacterium]|jgi:hypothetical protein